MSASFKTILGAYHYIVHDLSDPRSRDSNIILNPLYVVLGLTLYYKFVKSWGPKIMEKRKPLKIEKVLIVYNLFQIFISLYLFIISLYEVWCSGYYSLICQPLNFEDTPKERTIIFYIKLYYVIKIIDLLDTVFFIFRKKYNQVTFLHVYHHMVMVVLGFMTVKYVPGGHGVMLGTINTFVHSVMYTYYLLSTINPEYKKSIWWKKHITQIQIAQFLLLFIHFTHILFRPSCQYPKWVSLAFVPQNLFMLYMFTDFYIKTYIKKRK